MATLSSAQILEATVNMGVSKASQKFNFPYCKYRLSRYVHCYRRIFSDKGRSSTPLGVVGKQWESLFSVQFSRSV